jgi:hypothetical protein
MEKLDLRKQFKELYAPSSKVVTVVEVPELAFLMVDGSGDPNTSSSFQGAVQALYGVAYTLKFASKKRGVDYPVMPLEGLWSLPEGEGFDFEGDKSGWRWTLMIVQPDHISPDDVSAAVKEVGKKRQLQALDGLRLERFEEGAAVQIMHVGPYSAEKANFERLHARIEELGCKPSGRHHEIYLGDPRRSAPEKLRTVLRQPMRCP